MKKIYTLFASLFFTIALFAADARPMMSKLTIQSMDNSDIKVMIDGKRFDPEFNSLVLDNLRPGIHQIKVYKEKGRLINIFGNQRYQVVYNTTINVRAGTHTMISLDRFNRAKFSVVNLRNKPGNGYGRDRGDDRNRNFNDHEYDYDHDGRPGNQNDDWFDDDNGYGNNRHGQYDRNDSYNRPMSDYEFAQAMQTVSREWFENDKLKKAEQVVAGNTMTSSQVKQLVQLFSFENNKLELAKQAYANTIDKQNYYVVEDALSFNTSKRELEDFTRHFR